MSEPEGFLARWSRRKIESEREPDGPGPTQPPADAADAARPDPPQGLSDSAAPAPSAGRSSTRAPAEGEPAPFDPAKLPPIETISAATDIRDFLRPGVPAELRHAALRRAWSVDPAIRNYIGLSENAWDFNDPNAMLGFGPLQATDEVRRLVAQVFGDPVEPQPATPADAVAQDAAPRETTAKTDATPHKSPVAPADQAVPAEPGSAGRCEPRRPSAPDPAHAVAAIVQRDETPAASQHAPRQEAQPLGHAQALRRTHGRALPQ